MPEELKTITIALNRGVDRDSPPGSLGEGYASDARHMRFDNNVVYKMPGITEFTTTVAASRISGLYSFADHAGLFNGLRCRATKIHLITAAGGTVAFDNVFTGALTDRWTFAPFGNVATGAQIILITNGIDKVQKLVHPYASTDLTDMSADVNCPLAHVVRTYMRHVFLLGQPAYPVRVSWSDIDDHTDWTAVAANDAGSVDLYEARTPVVSGDTLKSLFVVYTRDQIHTFQYVGGTYVFSRAIADSTIGLWSRCLLVPTEDAQFFMSPTDFYAFDGVKPIPIGQRIRREVYAAILHAVTAHAASIDNAFAFHYKKKGEVWFCVPANSAYPDLACVYSYWNGSWSFEDFYTDAAATDPHAAGQINAGIDESVSDYPLIALDDKYVYYLGSGEDKALQAGTVAYTGYIDTPEFDGGDPEAMKHILKIVPDITAAGAHTIGFRVGTRDTRNSAITWTPALASAATAFDPDSDKHVDVRVSGRLGRIRIETSALNSPFQVNKLTVFFRQVGER